MKRIYKPKRKLCSKKYRLIIGLLLFMFWVSMLVRNSLMSQLPTVTTLEALTFPRTSDKPSFVTTTNTFKWREMQKDEALFHNLTQAKEFCDGKFIGYDNKYAKLLDVVVDPQMGVGKRGGENLTDVMNQTEISEYYVLKPGYFLQQCSQNITYKFLDKSHIQNWFNALKLHTDVNSTLETIGTWTIAVQRYEYVNFYHTMTDFFNAFLVAKMFKMTPGNINIFLVDGHPSGSLDQTWKQLFGKILRAGDVQKPVCFRKMVWSTIGYQSPLYQHKAKRVHFLEEYREFFLARHGILTTNDTETLNCRKLKVLFIWRRDYVAHPRNPTGSVSRKIHNEDELLTVAKEVLPEHNVLGIQIDKLTMTDQLRLISDTDILIGMHGAGLTHTLFLPQHAGLIELYPNYWPLTIVHFKAIAQWRHLHYLNWMNRNITRELKNRYTIIDTGEFKSMLVKMKSMLCG